MTHTLTADDLKALRMADASVCFFTDGTEESYIRCSKKVKGDPYRQEMDYQIQADGFINYYGSGSGTMKGRKAFGMVSCPKYDAVWQTVCAMLRVGDELTLKWTQSNNNQYVDDANLHVDDLRLCVKRGDKMYEFFIEYSICPDNSARMIKRV